MYDQVIAHIKDHVVTGADTQLLLAVDHDFGGLTLSSKWNQRPIAAASCTSEHLVSLLGQWKGDGHKGYLATELLRHYGLFNAIDDVLDTYKRSGSTPRVVTMGQALAAKAGIHWSTTSHISDDVDLYGAAGAAEKATGCWASQKYRLAAIATARSWPGRGSGCWA
ncbi:hypothetical protein MY5147_005354 [Beauveria neobassiana]|uniref:Alkaline phosphatase n=1 Tax=Beauveria bassiana D1-5 TaxID=1245745 RepID=A0A0A2V9W1_BEABA|nr:hypothetical protein BBAD15_g10473 [Beauveria bassiana D1-5]